MLLPPQIEDPRIGPSGHIVQADQRQSARGFIGDALAGSDQVSLSLRAEKRACPVEKTLVERDADCPGNEAGGELRYRSKIDDLRLAIGGKHAGKSFVIDLGRQRS